MESWGWVRGIDKLQEMEEIDVHVGPGRVDQPIFIPASSLALLRRVIATVVPMGRVVVQKVLRLVPVTVKKIVS